jgi:hypothetical protein
VKLELNSAALPTLATNCVLVGHAQKADVVWTQDDFMALCEHMMNGNERNFFLIPYRKEDGTAHFAKAKNARADRRASWAWDTITGRAKNPASIGFYPRNDEGKTRWGAMDFDAHSDNGGRVRELALAAFQILYRHPQLFVVLATSGSEGWHLFVFTRDFHDCSEWGRLFRQVTALIGVAIEKGVLEIFPSESRGRLGYAIRGPGTWNPKHDTFGLIAFENVSRLLAGIKEERERDGLFLSRSKDGVEGSDLTYRDEKSVYRGEFDEWQTRFAITALRTRREKLKAMVDHIFRQVGAKWRDEMLNCNTTKKRFPPQPGCLSTCKSSRSFGIGGKRSGSPNYPNLSARNSIVCGRTATTGKRFVYSGILPGW